MNSNLQMINAEIFHPRGRVNEIPDHGSASKNLSIFNPK
jgi:hypothetical protein